MPVIRFVREGIDVECYPGENLREVALRHGIELYGIKGKLGNCGGCGQCITCFVDIISPHGSNSPSTLSARTQVENMKLRRRPDTWRLGCQVLVYGSVLVLTRPQLGLPDAEYRIAAARTAKLSKGNMSWFSPEVNINPEQSTTSSEGDEEPALNSDTVS
uniref:Possible ferredoxin (2Fe-2S) n=1 Tax=Paulinella chromatophora TaxID=39717 RepID=B1X542_PAUCH|nr:possible ferredoxin (2Fe-2S) [Paulinella chromatophora]ACB43061.1 possible ferredoxin (2Fe-2S) [Paulinella chromatophora]